MAIPNYTTDLTLFNDASDPTGWDEFTNMASGAGPDVDTDLAIYGGTCITQDRANVGLNSQGYSGGAVTVPTNGAFFIWTKFFAPNSLDLLSAGGQRVAIGTDFSNWEAWYMDGSDTYNYGGWLNYAVDPTVAADATNGTVTTYNACGNGWLLTAAPQKGNPFNTDIIRYGRGESRFTDGDLANGYATFLGYSIVNDNPTTGRFGLIQASGAGYLFKGLMSLGLAATSVDMRDANTNLSIDNTTKVSSAFNRIEVHNASSNVEWNRVNITALGTVSKGEFEMVDNATVSFTDCVFTDMSTFIFQSGAILLREVFSRCGLVTQGGATFTSCTFSNSTSLVSLTVDDLSLVTKCSFTGDGSNHAIDLGVIGSTQSMTWDNIDSGYTDASSGNETILVSVDTGITLTINVAATGSTPTVYNTGLGTVNVVAGLKTFSFSLSPAVTGYEWRIYTVTAEGSLTGATEIAGAESATAGVKEYSYSYSVDQPIAVQIINEPTNDYEESITYYTLKNADQAITILLQKDENN
ncbi:MAG: hypothetical protein PF693_21560 [Spirochaetia bacterium]|jgi:hypothetical protein|nr:hypothetical protein [Spirochaetia bacterium]